jgi:UDP-glucose 4-epimerase
VKIFVTGVAGFLGSHLADRFLESGHEVVGVDSLIGGEIINVPPATQFYQYDCCDRNSVARGDEGLRRRLSLRGYRLRGIVGVFPGTRVAQYR